MSKKKRLEFSSASFEAINAGDRENDAKGKLMEKIEQASLDGAHKDLDYAITILKRAGEQGRKLHNRSER